MALKALIENLVENANEILPKLGGVQITGASCSISESSGPAGAVRKCTLQINTLQRGPITRQNSSSVEITELQDDNSEAVDTVM